MKRLINDLIRNNIEVANLLVLSCVEGKTKRELYNNPEVSAVDFNIPFRQASVSKIFIVVAIAKLIELSKISLHSNVSNYIGINNSTLTIKRLLSHTSGIEDSYGYLVDKEEAINIANKFSDSSLYVYSNLNYVLLALIIEEVVNMPFDIYVEELMKSFGVECSYNPTKFAEVGYLYRKGNNWNISIDENNSDYISYSIGKKSPQGGMKITINELAKFIDKLINYEILDKKTLGLILEYFQVKEAKSNVENCGTNYYSNGLQVLNADSNSKINFSSDIIYGHFGDAYGLRCGVFFNYVSKNYFIYFYTGTNVDFNLDRYRHNNTLYNFLDNVVFEYIWRTYESI